MSRIKNPETIGQASMSHVEMTAEMTTGDINQEYPRGIFVPVKGGEIESGSDLKADYQRQQAKLSKVVIS